LIKYHLPHDKSLVRECGYTESEGYAAMRSWVKEGKVPRAVFAANDPAAIGAMTALNDAGLRVPEDVALVGGGNIHYGDMLKVPLTTVSWSTSEMGEQAARLLIDLIDEKQKRGRPARVIVKPTLIIRQSCGADGGRE